MSFLLQFYSGRCVGQPPTLILPLFDLFHFLGGWTYDILQTTRFCSDPYNQGVPDVDSFVYLGAKFTNTIDTDSIVRMKLAQANATYKL
eukprot:870402-Amphidinium_carterae.1